MNMSRTFILGLLAVAALALVGGWLFTQQSGQPTQTSTTSPMPAPTGSPSPSPVPEMVVTPTPAVTITFNGSSFSPSTATVKSGDTVAIKNNSSSSLQFNSNPHPSHTDNSELNVGNVPPGETMTFKLTSKGTWGYHNHLNSGQLGTIIVN